MKTLKKLFKVMFVLLGIVGISSSCKKDGCITCSYKTESYSYCEADFTPGEEFKTWAQYVSYLKTYFDGKCN